MGVIRAFAKGLSGFLFLTFLVTTILLLGLVKFTGYENLKPVVSGLIQMQAKKHINETQLQQYVTLYCKVANDSIKINFTFAEIEVDCSQMLGKQPEEIIEIFSSRAFDAIYHRSYGCEFIDCLTNATQEERYLVVASGKANSFFKESLKYSLALTAFFLLIFLLAGESWYARVRDLGIALIVVGLPSFLLDVTLIKFLPSFLQMEAVEVLTPALIGIFYFFFYIFLSILAGGIAFLLLAFIIRLKSQK